MQDSYTYKSRVAMLNGIAFKQQSATLHGRSLRYAHQPEPRVPVQG